MTKKEKSERYEKGIKVMQKHFGEETDKLLEPIENAYAFFAEVNVEFPFGDLYSRDVLDSKTRELATIAALTVQGSSLPQLRLHTKAALNCGAKQEEIMEIITQMIAYCGFPSATNALLAAKSVFDELEERSTE